MSEREMLEWAARAAGIPLAWDDSGEWAYTPSALPPHNRRTGDRLAGTIWSPLANSEDALELAVKLGEQHLVKVGICRQLDKAYCHADNIAVRENLGSDPSAAVRKCIVRAAAAIGRAGGG